MLQAIRDRVGPDYIVGMRYTADEVHKHGLTAEDGLEICRMFRDSGMVYFLNVIRGRINHGAGLTDVIPIQGMPSSPHLDIAGRVRQETRMTTFHAAKIPSIATARHAIAEVCAESPNVVIFATGGWPHTEILKTGNHLVVASWDIISRNETPGENVLILDDVGDHPALQAAEVIAISGAKVEIMTPDRSFSPEVMAMTLVRCMRSLQDKDVTLAVIRRLMDVVQDGNKLKAVIGTDYSDIRDSKFYDQVVIDHGTLPMEDLYF